MSIPDDVMKTAEALWGGSVMDIARAIMADRESRWQPIETAPKDGTEIILYCPQGDGTPGKTYRVTAGQWFIPPEITHQMTADVEETDPPAWLSWDGGFSEETMMPTHWMPLPQPRSEREQL